MPDLGRQIVATQRDAEQEAHPGQDPVAVADAGPALDEVELEAERTSSAVAVSGERLSQAANRLQLEMWLRCECGLSLRAAMSSIIRCRSGLTVSVLLMESSILGEVHDTSILRAGLSTDYAIISTSLPSQIVAGGSACAPRSELERSDFVL